MEQIGSVLSVLLRLGVFLGLYYYARAGAIVFFRWIPVRWKWVLKEEQKKQWRMGELQTCLLLGTDLSLGSILVLKAADSFSKGNAVLTILSILLYAAILIFAYLKRVKNHMIYLDKK